MCIGKAACLNEWLKKSRETHTTSPFAVSCSGFNGSVCLSMANWCNYESRDYGYTKQCTNKVCSEYDQAQPCLSVSVWCDVV